MADLPSTAKDTKRTQSDTGKNGSIGQSVSARLLRIFQESPDRVFVVRDLVDLVGSRQDTITRILSRLSSKGKGAGPVRRISHGIYQFDPNKESNSLQDLIRSGRWGIENLSLVRIGAHPPPVSDSGTPAPGAPGMQSDTSTTQLTPLPGYPWQLPTGQCVNWGRHLCNGTEEIHLSVNGAPPFSPDHALTLIEILRSRGLEIGRAHV